MKHAGKIDQGLTEGRAVCLSCARDVTPTASEGAFRHRALHGVTCPRCGAPLLLRVRVCFQAGYATADGSDRPDLVAASRAQEEAAHDAAYVVECHALGRTGGKWMLDAMASSAESSLRARWLLGLRMHDYDVPDYCAMDDVAEAPRDGA